MTVQHGVRPTVGVLRWEAPPAALQGCTGRPRERILHELIAAQLRREPGRWAVVYEARGLSSLATQINRGAYAPYRPAGAYEATSRTVGDMHVVYARYRAEAGL